MARQGTSALVPPLGSFALGQSGRHGGRFDSVPPVFSVLAALCSFLVILRHFNCRKG